MDESLLVELDALHGPAMAPPKLKAMSAAARHLAFTIVAAAEKNGRWLEVRRAAKDEKRKNRTGCGSGETQRSGGHTIFTTLNFVQTPSVDLSFRAARGAWHLH